VADDPSPAAEPAAGVPEPAVESAAPAAAIAEGQHEATTWLGSLPPELQKDKTLHVFKGVEDLAKSYLEIRKTVGDSSVVRLPGKDATPAEVAAFREKIGVPKTADGYVFDLPATPEGVSWDEGAVKLFKGEMHKAGVPASAAPALFKAYAGWREAVKIAEGQHYQEGINALRQEWGEPLFARRHDLAVRTIRQFGGDEVADVLDATGLGNHPALFKMLGKIAEQFAEDGVLEGYDPTSTGADTAKEQIAAIRADKTHPANNPNAPGYAEARRNFENLYKQAYGTKEVGV
jgi:hypothetical protein